jgi:hypothetical protein
MVCICGIKRLVRLIIGRVGRNKCAFPLGLAFARNIFGCCGGAPIYSSRRAIMVSRREMRRLLPQFLHRARGEEKSDLRLEICNFKEAGRGET